jgi:hypothetical protein
MKEYLGKSAGAIGVVTAAFFAYIIWAYAGDGYNADTTYLIVAGLSMMILDMIVLYCLLTRKSTKKISTKKKGARK